MAWVKFRVDFCFADSVSTEEDYVWYENLPKENILKEDCREWASRFDNYDIAFENLRPIRTLVAGCDQLPEEIRQRKIKRALQSIERSVRDLVRLGFKS